ncbi:phage tail protein [Photobacterium frigidiphilum]|uniref:phage tail-collar fiber domain-containing protein n=1 Tax=Photobacterium frigidiphilum TaxID=264736 RepID=UPI003D0E8D38
MSQTAIPLEFERYMQMQISAVQSPDMNEMIFAYIPGLDLSQPIDRSQGLPDPSLWVHRQDIDQIGKLGDNALAYSVVILGSVDEFTFNAIYLHDKQISNSCGMVVHKAIETKENGMASTKSLVQQYNGAAQMVGITLDATTWQIDYQARLFGIEEDHRLACVDTYSHTAFVDGFDVIQQADPNKYKIMPGVVYIGGLRTVLVGEVLQTITAKPNGIYLDTVRQGTALSVWENRLTIRMSESELTDFVDEQGQQHYVAKLAGVLANGAVVDWRRKGGLADHESRSQFMPYCSHRQYSVGEVCYTRDAKGELSYWQWYSNVESLAGKDPTHRTNRHLGWTVSNKPFYWVPYTGDQVGMPFFWLDTQAPEWAVMEINVDLPVAVYWRLARRYPDLVRQGSINTGEIRSEFLRVLDQGRGIDVARVIGSSQADDFEAHYHRMTAIKSNGGDGTTFEKAYALNLYRMSVNYSIPSPRLNNGSAFNEGTETFGAEQHGEYQRPHQQKAQGKGVETRPRNIARPMAIAI